MTIKRRTMLGLTVGSAVAAATRASAQAAVQTAGVAPPDPAETIRLWPNGAPGGEGVTVTPIVPERSTDPAFHDRYAQYTTDPIMTVFRPERPNGSAMLLTPGGGYRWVVVDKEGYDVARAVHARFRYGDVVEHQGDVRRMESALPARCQGSGIVELVNPGGRAGLGPLLRLDDGGAP